jgi:ribosomal 30S subunit maturation factor RimM
MRRLAISIGLFAISSAPHDVSSFLQQQLPNYRRYYSVVASIRRPRLYAQEPYTTSISGSSSLENNNDRPGRRKKQNKYANLSKTDNLSMDPLDAMLVESRTKLSEMYREDSKPMKRRRKLSTIEYTSLEAIDRLLDDRDTGGMKSGIHELEKMEETRERNKRIFPDVQTIDPYDPTTYGYIELGTIIGAHGVHGLMKLASITDFSQHRLCEPGVRHIKSPNRRSPREVRLVEGRPLRSNSTAAGSDASPSYLIRLENVNDRDEAMKFRGYVLYALENEKVNNLLMEDEYIVSDLIGLNVFLDEGADEHSGKGFEDLFIGNIRGVILGSEMCSIPGLGQDLLEVARPSQLTGKGEELVLIPFVPQIVTRVDLDGRLISIMPPRGLLDLSYRREEKVRIKGLLPEISSFGRDVRR